MDSEKTQRSQKKEKVGAFVPDLKKKVLDHLEANSR